MYLSNHPPLVLHGFIFQMQNQSHNKCNSFASKGGEDVIILQPCRQPNLKNHKFTIRYLRLKSRKLRSQTWFGLWTISFFLPTIVLLFLSSCFWFFLPIGAAQPNYCFFCFGIKSYRFEMHQKIGVFPNGCSCFSNNHSEKRSCE